MASSGVVTQQQPRDWYEGTGDLRSQSQNEISIYEAAKARLLDELSSKEREYVEFDTATNMESLVEILQKATHKYQNKQTSKARKWLNIFSTKLTYYGKVLDVLVNHYPQYVSLAWGALKFLFVSVINHEEMTKELAKAYSVIADILPRTDFTLILYPTQAMKEMMAQLYANIILFTTRAIHWYKRGKFAHMVGAIAQPWALNWKDDVENIAEQSRRIDNHAQIAARAELRDTRLEVTILRTEFKEMSATANETYFQMKRMLELLSLDSGHIRGVVNLTQSLVQDIQPKLNAQRPDISRNLLAKVQALPWTYHIPSSEKTLDFCISMRESRKAPKLQIPELNILNTWAANNKSQLLFITSKSLQASKDFTIDLANIIHRSQASTIWVLRHSTYWEPRPTYVSILKSITLQALSLFPGCLTEDPLLSSNHLLEAKEESEWIRILSRVLRSAEKVYIILDAEIVALAGNHHRYRITCWLNRLMEQVQDVCAVKIFIPGTVIDKAYISRQWDSTSWAELTTEYVSIKDRPPQSIKSLRLMQMQSVQRRMGIRHRRR